ncbi:MAG: hypothetical protein C0P74_007500 [Gammaproteobacteria bacterium]|nr:hypothetical protein [Gammaproteobacteria bacterium]
MTTTCEVIGWLLDTDSARVLVREHDGRISAQRANADGTFANKPIQTGAFKRGKPIIDPITRETVGYEMEHLPDGWGSKN